MSHLTQDWEPVVLRKKAPSAAAKKDPKAVNEAWRTGASIETVKKFSAGTNKASSSSATPNAKKLEDDMETLEHKTVSLELRIAIQRARLEKKLTQAQLGQLINEKANVIQEYESGKAIPNPQVVNKLEKALGTKLHSAPKPAPKKKEAAK